MDVVVASAPWDGLCLSATRRNRARMARCWDPERAEARDPRAQRFELRVNAEAINVGDRVTLQSEGVLAPSYLSAGEDGAVKLAQGGLREQAGDGSAAFRVVDPICGANYHVSLESVDRPGFFLAADPANAGGVVLTDSLRSKTEACWLPTPGPARPEFGSGCPGITFALHSRSRRGRYLAASADGVVLSGEDRGMLTCWRPVPPRGAPSAMRPKGRGG
ncbi:hypothetical protein DFJ74DRAFT_652801 [Hyaloraphidium curvatum]|nr:hypothetical protein DFJ74DRAFT_652801 [Hyaloraphidium curvatum]